MARPYYFFSPGKMKRKDNTLLFQGEEVKKPLPVNDVEALYFMGEITLNSKLLNFLSQNKIPLHFFNYYGFYSGSFMPRDYLPSGFVLLSQAQHFHSKKKRLSIAKEIIESASFNLLVNLKYYNNRDRDLEKQIEKITAWREKIGESTSISQLMGLEGNIRKVYYTAFPEIITQEVEFKKRVKQPPDNMVNALISYGNSLLYTTVLAEIYHTQLSPLISFLHEPGTRRFSLSLDLAEIFKPLLVDRIIFKLLNTRQLTPKDFDSELNLCYLNEKGRKTYLQEYDRKLKQTIYHRKLDKKVSYRRIIRLECYKIIKLLTEKKAYEGFHIWW